jgi:putative spermidine/putrescine transport system permease protein
VTAAAPFSETFGRWLIRLVAWAILFFLVAPLVILIGASFSTLDYVSFPPRGFTLSWYVRFFEDPAFLNSFILSLEIAAGAALVATVIGFPAAYTLVRKSFPGRDALLNFFLAPLLVPQIILGVSLLHFLTLIGLGTSLVGLLAAHAIAVMPYVIRTVSAALVNTDPRIEEAAADLGAVRWEVLLLVVAPAVKGGLIAGALFAFIMSWINVEISIFLGGPGRYTLPVILFNFMEYSITTIVVTAASIAIIVSAVMVLLVDRIVGISAVSKV